jgi:hypothetical protein
MSFDDGTATIQIALVNEATTPPGVDLAAMVAALNIQVSRDVGPAWGLPPVAVSLQSKVPPGSWGLYLLDDADQAGALGYHDLTPDGLPIGKVFVKTTLDDKQIVSVTVSHELAEILIDPAINLAYQGSDGAFWAAEVCDAVEDQTYLIDGIAVSDFVYPAWFEPFRANAPAASIKFDFLDTLTHPFQLGPGGYISVFRGRRGWSQLFGSHAAAERFNPARKRRALRRGGLPLAE